MSWPNALRITLLLAVTAGRAHAGQPPERAWKYDPDLLRPFWQGTTVEGESVLFLKDPATGEAKASLLFPVDDVLAVRNSAGDVSYAKGRDFVWRPGSREIVLPAGSRIPSRTPKQLRRPANSQPFKLTHRDGDGEILFGARLEYAAMQTCITYRHAPGVWKSAAPRFDPKALPRCVRRLVARQPLSVVVLGDSISAGGNASGLFGAPPYQPAYPELLRQHLEARFQAKVDLTNLSVGGKTARWGLTQVEQVVKERPDLVIVAFGMNDCVGRTVEEYRADVRDTITEVRAKLPEAEFILVASMLGNRDWVLLHPEKLPHYRDALARLCGPGVALADLTSVWTAFLELKHDWDQTGNGVNHPNDFGHRVYAQVISTLLIADGEPPTRAQTPNRR
jgi:lysophospholipase L1-like esterase